jgi:GNAT superfamily N-acetyltransferase
MTINIRLLSERDDRSRFSSGNVELDRFFKQYAGQNQFRHHIGSTYVAVDDDSGEILGFATIAPAHIDELPEDLRRSLPQYPLPVLRLGRLAVSGTAQAQGLGKALLRFVFDLALKLSIEYGCTGVLVDAKKDVEQFYQQYGFYRLEVAQGRSGIRPFATSMFLPIGTIRQAMIRKKK